MPIRPRHVIVSAAVALALALASCDRSPTKPAPTQVPTSTTPVVVRLEIVAPTEIAPGESVQLVANAVKSDGSVENVTTQSQWSPPGASILEVNAAGLVTGKARGEQFVTARYASRTANARIFVVPKGTYRLSGSVKEGSFPITNATVTVISGVEAGLTTISGSDGFYALYGVSGPVQIQIRKDGYLNRIEALDVTAHRTVDLQIVAERARSDYRGVYTLTITAPSQCRVTSGVFPDSAKRRVYTANVAQDGPGLRVTLSDADFIVSNGHGNGFSGFIEPTEAIQFRYRGELLLLLLLRHIRHRRAIRHDRAGDQRQRLD